MSILPQTLILIKLRLVLNYVGSKISPRFFNLNLKPFQFYTCPLPDLNVAAAAPITPLINVSVK